MGVGGAPVDLPDVGGIARTLAWFFWISPATERFDPSGRKTVAPSRTRVWLSCILGNPLR